MKWFPSYMEGRVPFLWMAHVMVRKAAIREDFPHSSTLLPIPKSGPWARFECFNYEGDHHGLCRGARDKLSSHGCENPMSKAKKKFVKVSHMMDNTPTLGE